MRYRELGTTGIEASAVGLGCWAIGGFLWGGTDEAAAVDAIRASLDSGVTLVDTAPIYGFGLSEELVGKGIAGRRDQVVLATKCGLVWHTKRGEHSWDVEGRSIHRYLGPDSIRFEIEESLRRLGTDRVDLYQTHWQEPTTPIEDTMAALLDLQQQGKIRAIGVSNAQLEQLQRYVACGTVASAQERYSMLDRGLEATLLPYCREHGISILAYSPLANGLLTGKISPDRQFKGDDLRRDNPRFGKGNLRKVAALLKELQPIAERHQVTVGQIVIAWTLVQPGVTFALVGARNPVQARENAAAGDIELSAEELRTVDDVLVRRGPGIR